MPTHPLNLANIEEAAELIDPAFLHSPQYEDETLNAALEQRVLVKVETANPIRSFKGRGADFFARSLDPKQRIVCASAGNFGQAMAYVGRRRRIPVQVFVANDVNPAKAERMRSLGAMVTLCDGDFEVAKQNARRQAVDHPNCIFVEDGAEDAITEGAGTIGVELLAAGTIDTVVVPLGDGALITGIAAWIKDRSPGTQIIGVCPEATPAMLHAWREARGMRQVPGVPHPSPSARGGGALARTDVNQPTHTIADGIEVRVPVQEAVAVARAFDEMGRGMLGVAKSAPEGQALRAMIERYLSTRHANSPGMGCVVAALGPELARKPLSVRKRIEASLEAYREQLLPFVPGRTREEKLAKLQLLFSSMAGVLTMVRVTSSPQRRKQMLTEARKFFVKNFTER